MHERSSKRRKKPRDLNLLALSVVDEATARPDVKVEEVEPEEADKIKNAAAALGRLGGLKGGPARAAKLTAERRTAIAKKAASKRWSGSKSH